MLGYCKQKTLYAIGLRVISTSSALLLFLKHSWGLMDMTILSWMIENTWAQYQTMQYQLVVKTLALRGLLRHVYRQSFMDICHVYNPWMPCR